VGEFIDEMNARNDKDYLTKEDKRAIAKLPKSVFDFMGLCPPDCTVHDHNTELNKPLKG
jgi:hypothetical protein